MVEGFVGYVFCSGGLELKQFLLLGLRVSGFVVCGGVDQVQDNVQVNHY